ncbi:MAG: hypothetical protein Q9193_007274, partial [Seirophora villosa]
SGSIDVAGWIVSLTLLLWRGGVGAFLEILESAEVARLNVLRILQSDYVFAAEVLFADEISPVLRFDVEAVDRIIGEDVAGVSKSYEVCVVGEDLEGDRVDHFPIVVLRKVQLNEVGRLKGSSGDGVGAVFFQP